MNYEEKYNQTIESIKRIYNQADSYGKELMEKEFPQLRESEDERIKKCIGMCLTDVTEQRFEEFNTTLKDCLAWLEKQGEQKPSWNKEDERIRQCLIRDQEKALDDVRNDKYGHSEIISDLKEIYRERIDWLKSLKPYHWKPSEQNIKDLEWCADLVKDKMGVGFNRLQVFIDELKQL